MTISDLAGKPAPKGILGDPARLEREYYARKPDTGDPNQLVIFGTSGHRGSPVTGSFTEAHVAAIAEANPPEDGGFKFNPPHGGPADTDVTGWIEDRANAFLRDGNVGVRRVPYAKAITAATTRQEDFVLPYVRDLENVVDLAAIRGAGLRLAVDPLGGAGD
jgi:phosphoglucomutase